VKEHLRMQFLAGVIAESEYKAKLNEIDNSKLVIYLYDQIRSSWKGSTLIDSVPYSILYVEYKESFADVREYNKDGSPSVFSEKTKDFLSSYFNKLNIKHQIYTPEIFGGTGWGIRLLDLDQNPNIELIFTDEPPNFTPNKKEKADLKILDFFIKRDTPDWNDDGATWWGGTDDVYDFGGGDGPISPEAVVVDIYLTPNQKKNPSKFIEADLSKYIKLPPKKIINISSAVAQINSPNNLSKTIKHALKPGGILVIHDHIGAVQDLLKYLKDFKLLEIHYDEAEDPENITPSDQVFVVLKK